ncbi:tRNA preQ1(34) S-adenosylmethionine ribosyltransferase-isomerase QueA [Scatolibacter rhodanostii]|uniref:tRNA preQ1(34) S-adenosylmethionine ribosyltransferase-isomerase QueA n=1 Tax=Scatolibacter rhodanostii TaxID=2014781 RepID=UPI000C06D435|nr:tRNA preQ1(34) S-adenosylmethionine ribosyltransferase-isomerase QueA [Scatolibacter rhodanostii]
MTHSFKTSDFYYDLPEELIAQTPLEKRDTSRLLMLNKQTGEISHEHFYDIVEAIHENDCLILNDSRVLPARIYGTKKETGAVVEFLLLKNLGEDIWECLAGPGRKAKVDTEFTFGEGLMQGKVVEVKEDGNRLVKFSYDGVFFAILDKIGQMPLPPYIHEKLKDQERYQTVYSKELGSAAAPTAGLHFTEDLLDKLRAKGVKVGFVTLHVGLGTFRSVSAEFIDEHKMHSEHYYMPQETADIINETRKNGGRVIAVGTTSCRTLESCADENGHFTESNGWTEIFIYPGYTFKGIDALITNFHLPESTLVMLVSALAGKENILHAYEEAVKEKYRFFSFGDAMFIS